MIVRTVGDTRVVFTDRHGGVSRAPYTSANLADHVGDAPANVAENRRRTAGRAGIPGPERWVCLTQVHGDDVVSVAAPPATPPAADAAVTTAGGLPLVILVADCAPLALIAAGGIAAVHAGWAGLERGVVQRAAEALQAVAPGPVRAVLGPCIHAERYEFGPDLLERLVHRFGAGVAGRTHAGTPALDVPAAVRVALREVGIDDLDDVGICTAASPDHFSYRRDGVTGRQALIVVREP